MWGAAVIVFREIFEIAIVMCVVLAATKNVKNKQPWIWLGIGVGTLGASFVALLTQALSLLSSPQSKYYINAFILFAAVLMISWTVIWMKNHSRTIVSNLKKVSQSIVEGQQPLYMLSVIIGLSVLREGSEIVIFLYGLKATGQLTWLALIIGSMIGLAAGVTAGFLMYFGLIRMSIKYLFQTTSILLTFIAAGMAANAAGKLVQAGFLPALIDSVWNTSAILPQKQLLGKFLFILIGYQENPNGMQVVFYLLTMLLIWSAIWYQNKMHTKSDKAIAKA